MNHEINDADDMVAPDCILANALRDFIESEQPYDLSAVTVNVDVANHGRWSVTFRSVDFPGPEMREIEPSVIDRICGEMLVAGITANDRIYRRWITALRNGSFASLPPDNER